MKDLGLYLNFPFCVKKCRYCDFNSFDGMHEFMPAYIEALKKEITGLDCMLADYRIKTIYMGGGTPTLFHEISLSEVIKVCHDRFNISPDAEITIESNPATLNRRKLKTLREAGINRISVGLQAAQDYHLRVLGRQHTSNDFMLAIEWAAAEGFENINADILLSLPGQSSIDLTETIDMAVKASVTHVSLYSLRLEENTPLYEAVQRGEITLPEDDEERIMFHEAKDLLIKHGFFRYEISNFARKGFECAHNLTYWHNNEFVGCGSNAHSYFSKTRYANYSGIREYIESVNQTGAQTKAFTVQADVQEERFDTLMLELRLITGINKLEFEKRFGRDISFFYKKQIDYLKTHGLLAEDVDRLHCTQKGLDLQNYVLLKFMD